MTLVSIIIPMYNVARFLDKCVDSVLRQRMETEDFEIIMIDDGSPDNSYEVALRLAEKVENIKVIAQQNKGLGGARNTGMQNASGKYLIFLDADDILVDDKLHTLIKLADKHNLDILEFGATQIDEDGNLIATIAQTSNNKVYDGITYFEKINYMNSACNKLYRTEFLMNQKLWFTEKIYAEDFEFNTRSFFFVERIMATDIIGASFLLSTGSITRNKDKSKKDKFVNDFTLILKKIKTFKESHLVSGSKNQVDYFNQRIAICNLGLFYFMFKNAYSYKEMLRIKNKLKEENIYTDSIKVKEKRRELFRKVMLKNFFIFKLTQGLRLSIKA